MRAKDYFQIFGKALDFKISNLHIFNGMLNNNNVKYVDYVKYVFEYNLTTIFIDIYVVYSYIFIFQHRLIVCFAQEEIKCNNSYRNNFKHTFCTKGCLFIEG